jgi:hypothetical protein
MVDEPVTLLGRLRRQRALLLGLGLGLLGAVLIQRALDPAHWFPGDLGRVYVAGTCSYSRVTVDMLAADPDAPWVALPLPVDTPDFDGPICHATLQRLQAGGTWWLALLSEQSACLRLQRWSAAQFERETPAQGFPAWVDAQGRFRGFGVDPGQIASLGLTPTEKIVRFWIEGGYERALVEGFGFIVPADVEQGLPLRSPQLRPEPHARRG